jgi:hypothetical protein
VKLGVVYQFEFCQHSHLSRWCHPEQSRFSGGARDLARGVSEMRARSLGPLAKARAFGMTPQKTAKMQTDTPTSSAVAAAHRLFHGIF